MKHDQHEKIKFALIGCGAIANKHMIAINRIDNAEVVALMILILMPQKLSARKTQFRHLQMLRQ